MTEQRESEAKAVTEQRESEAIQPNTGIYYISLYTLLLHLPGYTSYPAITGYMAGRAGTAGPRAVTEVKHALGSREGVLFARERERCLFVWLM